MQDAALQSCILGVGGYCAIWLAVRLSGGYPGKAVMFRMPKRRVAELPACTHSPTPASEPILYSTINREVERIPGGAYRLVA